MTIRVLFALLTVAMIVLIAVNLRTINGTQGLVIIAAIYAGIGQITTWNGVWKARNRNDVLEFHPQGGIRKQ